MKMKNLSKITQRNQNLSKFRANLIRIDKNLAQTIDQCKNISIKSKTFKALRKLVIKFIPKK